MSIKDLLENPSWLAAYLRSKHFNSSSYLKSLTSLVAKLMALGKHRVGIDVSKLDKDSLPDRVGDGKQHPVIPTRLYFDVMTSLNDDIAFYSRYQNELRKFIGRFKDPTYGKCLDVQKRLGGDVETNPQPTFLEAAENSNLSEFFKAESCDNTNSLMSLIGKIQYSIALSIHMYTGMRRDEALRLTYSCLDSDSFTLPSNNKVSVSLISTTTKFTGFRKEVRWYAPDDVIAAIELGKALCRGLSECAGCSVVDAPLLISPAVIQVKSRSKIKPVVFKKRHKPKWFSRLIITPDDYKELIETDEDRDWASESDFAIGKTWHLTSHQFRRSLAFYAANSGLVSLPSLRRQFKHLSLAMARYYTNGFENLATMFGMYNAETSEYEIPSDHFIFEFQSGVPIATVNRLMNDIFNSDETLFGKRGGYIERVRNSNKDEIAILEIRSDTEKRVHNGELAYKDTLLGGCLSTKKCDSAMLGDFYNCIGCDESAIKQSKLEAEILQLETEVSNYTPGTGEYQVTLEALNKLKAFHTHRMASTGTN